MTVSPRWPHDDAAKSSDADHRLAAENGAGRNLPPTLFSLPNLNRAPTTPGPVQAPTIQAPTIQAPTIQAGVVDQTVVGKSPDKVTQNGAIQNTPTNSTAPSVGISPAAADAAALETQATDLSSSSESAPGQSFHERLAPVANVPAGRSWMEVTRQHGVVVMLLLVVVATAIFTGRDSNNDLADDAIADAVDIGQIDLGIASNAPLPVQQRDSETGVVASQQTWDPAPGDVGSVPSTANPMVPASDAGTLPRDSGTSFASLQPPQTGAIENSTNFGGNQRAVDSSGKQQSQSEVAAIEFVPPQVDAKTVANRAAEKTGVDSDIAFNPPSLESLAESLADGDPSISNDLGGVQANSFVPVSSTTPAGISDWLKFLPALPNDTSK